MTTKSQLISILNAKHYKYSYIDDMIVVTNDNHFGNTTWFAIYYRFHKNKVYKISYKKHSNTTDVPKDLLDQEYLYLSKNLNAKYKRYSTRNFSSIFEDFCCFQDSKNRVVLEKGYFQGRYILSLSYICITLEKQRYYDGENEL